MLLLGIVSYIHADNTYVVTVTVTCEYAYYSVQNGNLLGRQSTTDQSQTFTICAESEGAAIREAIYQCSSMCESNQGQYQGTATYGGEKCKKYLVRRIGKTEATKYGSC